MDALNMTYDVSKMLTGNRYTRSGYSFNGWNTEADGSGDSYTDQQSVMNLVSEANGTITLYAQWEISTVSLTIKTHCSDTDQTFVYTVTGETVDGRTVTLTVAMGANDQKTIVNLPAGSYTITDQEGWSWRYSDQTITQSVYTSEVVDFTYGAVRADRAYWLNDYDERKRWQQQPNNNS
jgi:uncharacterized repeat protein (TIGR02543 family)